MNLIKKVTASLLLPAAILSGCVTAGPWTYSHSEFKEVSKKTILKNVGEELRREKEFHISSFSFVGDSYKAKVTESLSELVYDVTEQKEEKQLEETLFVERKTEVSYRGPLIAATTIGGLMIGLIGASANVSDSTGIFDKEVMSYWVVGMGIGAFLGKGISKNMNPTITTEKGISGTRDRKEYSTLKPLEIFSHSKLVYSNRNSGKVEVGFIGEKGFETDNLGEIIITESSGEYFTKERLRQGLKDFPLMQQIKPNISERLEDKIVSETPLKKIRATVETRARPLNSLERIRNGSRMGEFNIYEINEALIYSAVRQFVEDEINSKIKPVNLRIEDGITHFPIRGSTLKFEAYAPSPSELAEEYFLGDMKNYAERFISKYLTGYSELSCPETITVLAYCPSKIKLEVINPNYNFVVGEFEVKGETKKKVYMMDKGQKVRVDAKETSLGSIE